MRDILVVMTVLAVGVYPVQGQTSILHRLQGIGGHGGSFSDHGRREGTDVVGSFPSLPGVQSNDLDNRVKNEAVLDKRVDPETYRLGCGDELTVYLWGGLEKAIRLDVNSEGRIIVPLVGTIDVKDMTLATAKERVRSAVEDVYPEANVAISLSAIRRFRAYVVGEVKKPGAYTVDGMTRVSDVLEKAGGIIVGDTTSPRRAYCRRGVRIANGVLGERYADLAAFYNNNDVEANPYLVEGDRVYVAPRTKSVTVTGAVNYAGDYSILEGEKLATLLKAVGGLARGADSSRIVVSRFVGNGDSLRTSVLGLNQARDMDLKPDDRFHFCYIPDYRVHREVHITGEVKFPGTYAIREDSTRLLDIVEIAGGFTADTFLRGSKIVRKRFTRTGDREFGRLKVTPVSALSPLERSFLKTRIVEEEGVVSLDFGELVERGGDMYNVLLRNGDVIEIARRSLSVKVSGAVVSPGLVSYQECADLNYYLRQAGGLSERARKRKIMIIKGGSENWLRPREVDKIEAGDVVWVPEKTYRDPVELTRNILGMLGSVAMVLTTYITVSQAVTR